MSKRSQVSNQATDKIFLPIVVEIMTRATMMSYIGIVYGGMFDGYVADFQSALSNELQGSLANAQFDQLGQLKQFKEITYDLESGEQLQFIAKVPEGYSYTDVVKPEKSLIAALKNLRDGNMLHVVIDDQMQQVTMHTDWLEVNKVMRQEAVMHGMKHLSGPVGPVVTHYMEHMLQ